jgi:predicted PurR-regulated permease PerM
LRRQKVETILAQIDGYVAAFVRGQFLVGACMAFLYAVALWWLGIELWFLVAVIAGFGNLIPYLGTLIGIILGSLMALVTFGDISHLLWLWGIFGLVQFVEGSLLTPKIIGDSVGLSPLVVILSIVAAGSLFGLLGIFLAIPGAAVVRVLLSHSHRWILTRA